MRMISRRVSAIIWPSHLSGPSGGWCSSGTELRANPTAIAKQSLWTWVYPGTPELPLPWEPAQWLPTTPPPPLSGKKMCVLFPVSPPTKEALYFVSSSESLARLGTDPGFLLLSLLGLFAGDHNPSTLVANYIYGS